MVHFGPPTPSHRMDWVEYWRRQGLEPRTDTVIHSSHPPVTQTLGFVKCDVEMVSLNSLHLKRKSLLITAAHTEGHAQTSCLTLSNIRIHVVLDSSKFRPKYPQKDTPIPSLPSSLLSFKPCELITSCWIDLCFILLTLIIPISERVWIAWEGRSSGMGEGTSALNAALTFVTKLGSPDDGKATDVISNLSPLFPLF